MIRSAQWVYFWIGLFWRHFRGIKWFNLFYINLFSLQLTKAGRNTKLHIFKKVINVFHSTNDLIVFGSLGSSSKGQWEFGDHTLSFKYTLILRIKSICWNKYYLKQQQQKVVLIGFPRQLLVRFVIAFKNGMRDHLY